MNSGRSQSCELSALLEVVRLVGEELCSLEEVPLRLQNSILQGEPQNNRLASATKRTSSHLRSHSHGGASQQQPASSDATQPSTSRLLQGGPCMSCGVTEAPQWRRPDPGNLLLCNRCGIHYMRYRKLPGPRKDGPQVSKATPPDSPMHAGKRKADQMPDDQDTVAPVPTATARHPSTPSQSNTAGAPANDPVILHKAHVRRPPTNTSSSILDSNKQLSSSYPQPLSSISSDSITRDQGTATHHHHHQSAHGADQRTQSVDIPRVTVPERRRSSGPVLQGAMAYNGPNLQAKALDPHQLRLFLQLTQTMNGPQSGPGQQHGPPVARVVSASHSMPVHVAPSAAVGTDAVVARPAPTGTVTQMPCAQPGIIQGSYSYLPGLQYAPLPSGTVVMGRSALPQDLLPMLQYPSSAKHSAPIPIPATQASADVDDIQMGDGGVA